MAIKILITFLIFLSSAHLAFANDFYNKMSALYQKRDFGTIEQECSKEIKNNPKSLDAYYFLIAIRLHEAKFEEAKPYLDKFQRYHNELEKIEAQKRGARFHLIDARYSGLYFEIGKSHFMNNDFSNAIQWLFKAKSFFYNDPMLNFFLGISYKETKNFDEALKYLKRQLENNPTEPSPYYNIACVYAVQGKTDDSVKWLKKAIEAHPAFKSQAKKDKDFDKIRNSKEFKTLINN
jgi:tetratricopeptide (TPR) repeat protein